MWLPSTHRALDSVSSTAYTEYDGTSMEFQVLEDKCREIKSSPIIMLYSELEASLGYVRTFSIY